MVDPKDMPRPPRPKTAEAGDNFPPPPPGMGPSGPGPQKGAKKKHKKPKLEGDHVWININGKVAPRRVKIGLSDGVNVQILKGLDVGDSVVTSQETVSAKGSSEPNAKSPFMPQRPGKKKK
jgi:HlyD family secretion protein